MEASISLLPSLMFNKADTAIRVLKAMEHAMCVDETRYALQGIAVYRDSANDSRLVFESTDGHRACRIVVEACEFELANVMIGRTYRVRSLELSIALAKVKAKAKEPVSIELRSEDADEKWPEFQRVLPPVFTEPKRECAGRYGMNPAYVADACKAAAGLSRDKGGITIQTPVDEHSPIAIERKLIEPFVSFLAVVMPMRV